MWINLSNLPRIDLIASELPLGQDVAFINIAGCLLILSCVFTLFTAISGNYLIDYFKLDIKYPKLAKILFYRRKFTNFNIIINFLIILIVLIMLLYLNFSVLYFNIS